MMKRAILFLMLCATAAATTRYIAQSAGSVTCNGGTRTAITPATFNATTLAAADIAYVCGTITASAGTQGLIIPKNGGSAGNNIQIIFDAGAIIQAPYFGVDGGILLNGINFVTIDGANSGTIQNTLNGDSGLTCPGGACTNQQVTSGILINGGDTIEVKNLSILNMYVHHHNSSSNINGSPQSSAIEVVGGTHITLDGNTVDYSYYGFFREASASGSNQNWGPNNTFTHFNWAFGVTAALTGIVLNHVNIFGNTLTMSNAWDDTTNSNHHNGLYAFTDPSGAGQILDLNYYNNKILGTCGQAWTSTGEFFMSYGVPSPHVFNNIMDSSCSSGDPANGYMVPDFGTAASSTLIVNNTVIGSSSTAYTNSYGTITPTFVSDAVNVAETSIIKNNIVSTVAQGTVSTSGSSFTQNYDDLYNIGLYYGVINSTTYATFGAWQGAGFDANGITTSPNLNSSYVPNAGSPVIGTGVNLFSTCNGQSSPGLGDLCKDINGTPRPTVAAWDMGAVQSSSSTVATPTFSPVAGTYTGTQTVTISTSTGGATLCYTTDGSTPTGNGAGTCTHGTTYSGTVSVSVSETLKAIGTESGFTDSAVGSAAYVIVAAAATPTFSPVAGSYSSTQTVTISTTSGGAIICYTVNTPTTPATNGASGCSTGTLYSGTVSVASSQTLYAVAGGTGFADSSIGSAAYVITTVPNAFLGPSSLSYGTLLVGTTSSFQRAVLSNSGSTLTITSGVVTGDFALAGSTTCANGPLGNGGTCHYDITFTPTTTGARSGTLTVTDDNGGIPGSTQVVNLSGTGAQSFPGALFSSGVKITSGVMITTTPQVVPTGAQLTYNAITDQCELGVEANCASGLPLPFLGCNYWNGTYTPGALAWSSGTTYNLGDSSSVGSNVYYSLQASNVNHPPASSPTFWTNLGPCGTAPVGPGPSGLNTVITEPHFNSNVVQITDYAHTPVSACGGVTYNNGASSSFSYWAVDSSKVLLNPVSGTSCIAQFLPGPPMSVVYSDIGGGAAPGCTTGCTKFISSSGVVWTNTDPNSLFEVDGSNAVIYKDTITNPSSSPSVWVFNRVKVFNFLTDCSGPCGVPSAFAPNWNGVISAADDDLSLTFASSDVGQTKPTFSDGSHVCPQPGATTVTHYGPSFIFSWTSGAGPAASAGWRTYNTCGFQGVHSGTPFIDGNFGTTGVPTDGTTCTGGSGACNVGGAQQAVGTSGGCAIPDQMYLHDSSGLSDDHYSTVGPNASQGSQAGSCGATVNNCSYSGGKVCVNSSMYWEVGTTNVRASLIQGHNIKGFLYQYIGKSYKANGYHNPQSTTAPNGNVLIQQTHPTDDHGSYNNGNSLDQQPIMAATINAENAGGATGVPGFAPSPTLVNYYGQGLTCASVACAWWNENIAVENSVGNFTNGSNLFGQHCNYGSGPNTAACVYRFGQSYNTGYNWNFGISQAILNNSPDGKYGLFTSDWNNQLGCTNGWDGVSAGQACLDPVSASNNATSPTISNVAVDSAGTVAVITVANTSPVFSIGMLPKFTGFTGADATFLNNLSLFVTSFSGTQVNVCVVANGSGNSGSGTAPCTVGGIGHASYGASQSSGTMGWTGCGNAIQKTACARGDEFVMDLTSAHP